MGSETRAITDRVTKQIVTIFSKTCNNTNYFSLIFSELGPLINVRILFPFNILRIDVLGIVQYR